MTVQVGTEFKVGTGMPIRRDIRDNSSNLNGINFAIATFCSDTSGKPTVASSLLLRMRDSTHWQLRLEVLQVPSGRGHLASGGEYALHSEAISSSFLRIDGMGFVAAGLPRLDHNSQLRVGAQPEAMHEPEVLVL